MKCWPFNNSHYRTPFYSIEVELFLTVKGEWNISPVEFLVDTGFDGDILLAEDEFRSLGFSMFEEDKEEWDMGETIAGEQVILRSSHSEIRLENSTFEVQVETFNGNMENLIGRGLLNRFLSQINGFNQEFCCSVTLP